MSETTAPAPKLRASEKFSYGFGDFASCLYWQTFMAYLTFYYTDVFGIPAAAAGTMLALSRSVDAFFDPVMGMVADRTQTRWGKFRPYLLWFAVPFAVVGVLTFSTPALPASGKLIWAWVTYNALMLLYTAINIPYTAMLGVLTPNPNERTALSSVKFVGAFAGGMLVSFSLLPMAKKDGWLGASSDAAGWRLAFIVIGVVAVASFLVTFFFTRERVQPPKEQKSSVGKDLKDLVTNGPWLALVAATLAMILFVACRSSVTAHYFKYFVGPQTLTLPSWVPKIGGTQTWEFESLVSIFNTTGQLMSLLGVVLLPFVTRWIGGRKATFTVLFLIAIVCNAAYYFLGPNQLLLIYVLNGLYCVTAGPLSALLWAMYADTADYSEWKRGRRATGLVFSASIFSQKQGWAIGAAVSLGIMQHVGFKANVEQSPESLHGLVLLVSVIPAVFGLLSLVALALYPLNEHKVAEISAALRSRHTGDEAVSP
jgi:glycoside/pentoside/hexuronide:cation symporter, GPH family